MKTIILILFLSLNLFAQSSLLLLMSDTTTSSPPVDEWTPTDLSPILYLVHDDSVVASGSKTVVSWTDNGFTFTEADTTVAPIQTDSSIYFPAGGTKTLVWTDTGTNPFDIGLGDMSVDAWIYYSGDGGAGTIISKGGYGLYDFWKAQTANFGEIRFAFTAGDSLENYSGSINTTDTDSLTAGWHHCAFTWDRNLNVIAYKDSIIRATETTEWTDMVAESLGSTYPAYVGGAGLGHIAVIRFYNTVLTPAQVKQLYEFGRE